MSDIKTSCSCHSDQNLLKYIWSRLVRKRSDCICNRLAIQMDNNDQEPRPEERPSLDTSTEEEEDEEDVKICVDMAALNVTRPHTQVDYYHHLVPFLSEITNSSFYWGKMDRYEAESLLEDKPEGSFLLRDSAQDEYLFSVSFRRYGRSLHARIEEQSHEFSFDCHDPGVYMNRNIPQLLDHYKDPASCMFFEPMLCHPINRKNPFSLQSLSRAAICDTLTNYSDVDTLELPKSLKGFLKEYHYRHRLRVRRYDL